jgi:hypothetical protein
MNRPPATSFRAPLAAVLLALAQLGCSGGDKAQAEKPVDVTEAVKTPKAELTPSSTPEIARAPAQTSTPTPVPAPASLPPPAQVAQPAATPEVAAATPPKDEQTDAKAKPQQKAEDPLKWLQESEAKKAEYQSKLAEASGKVAAADAKVAEWEKNVLAFKIPYRARPELSEKDADAIAGKGGADRVHWAEDQLATARTERDAAQKALDDLRANPPQ